MESILPETRKDNQPRILILFAPKFREFGADVGNELVRRGTAESIDGICTGGPRTIQAVRERLGKNVGMLYDLESDEGNWTTPGDDVVPSLKQMEEELGPSIVGKTLTSDRRVGAGFVMHGDVRPSALKTEALRVPALAPTAYIARLYRYLDEILEITKPRLVFFYAIAGAPAFLLAQMCVKRGITVKHYVSARLGSRALIDTDPLGRFFIVRDVLKAERDEKITLEHLADNAHEALQTFRDRPSPPEYESNNAKKLKEASIFRAFASAMKLTAAFALKRLRRRNITPTSVARTWFEVKLAIKRSRYKENSFASIPPGYRVVFFPLHVDPEASTMVLAPWHTNQLAVIEQLAKSIPADAVLAVKEHKWMIGRRPDDFYRRLSALPRVVLVDPFSSGLWWIQNSDLTVVITGTSAWEAMRLGKPALVVGDSPYLTVGEGVVHEPCLNNLPQAIQTAFQQPPARDEALVRFLRALYHVSFEFKSSILWNEYLAHDEAERNEAVRNFCDGIGRSDPIFTNHIC